LYPLPKLDIQRSANYPEFSLETAVNFAKGKQALLKSTRAKKTAAMRPEPLMRAHARQIDKWQRL